MYKDSSKQTLGDVLVMLVGLCVVALSPVAEAVDYSISGFGSLVGGMVTNDPSSGYIASFPEMGIYGSNSKPNGLGPTDNGWLNQESKFGIQGTVNLDDNTHFTVQEVARGTDGYTPKVEWAYVTRDITNELNLQVGKMRPPVYLYSDKMDAGFAYPWLRVPSDAYSLDSLSFNGAKLNYTFTSGELNERLSLYTGTEQVTNSKLMSFVFNTPISRRHNYAGIVADTGYGPFQLRLSYLHDSMDQSTSSTDPANAFRNAHFDEQFIDYALQYQTGNLTLVGEYNQDMPFYKSWFCSAIYQLDENALYITRSAFNLNEAWEQHHQLSVGVRHDIGSNQDLKFDVTQFVDEGSNPFTGAANPVIGIAPGNSMIASVSYDFVF